MAATEPTAPDKTRRIFFVRVVASIALFVAFVVLSVGWVFTAAQLFKWSMMLPLIASVAIMPREVPVAVVPDESAHPRARLWLSTVRLIYFLVALGILAGLPELIA